MACNWGAPCGCIIEFEGQLVDIGAPVKQYIRRCDRHSYIECPVQCSTAALDENKCENCYRAELEADGHPDVGGVHVEFSYSDGKLHCDAVADDKIHADLCARADKRRKSLG